MALLIAGVTLFVGVHLVPSAPSFRTRLRERLGAGPYMGLFSLGAALGLLLIVVGFGRAPFVYLWTPPSWARDVAIFVMPVAVTSLVGAYVPSNLKRFVRHPMLVGVSLWAAVHLFANGDLASLVLFGSLGAFAVFDIVSANRRGATRSSVALPIWRDLLLLLVGGVVYMAIFHGHGWLFGVPVAFGQ